VPDAIVQRQLSHFAKVDPAYAEGIAAALGVAVKAAWAAASRGRRASAPAGRRGA